MGKRSPLECVAEEQARLKSSVASDSATIAAESSVGDMVDHAQNSSTDEVAAELIKIRSKRLEPVARIKVMTAEGRRNICEICKRKIPQVRLDAVPLATKCVTCQSEEEAGQL